MISKNAVQEAVNEWLAGKEYFLVDLSVSADDRVVVVIDHADGVWIDAQASTRSILRYPAFSAVADILPNFPRTLQKYLPARVILQPSVSATETIIRQARAISLTICIAFLFSAIYLRKTAST